MNGLGHILISGKENVHRDRVFWETSHMNLNFMDICPTSSETSGKIEWWVEGWISCFR